MNQLVQSLKTYSQAVDANAYGRNTGGLFGKNDNVRRLWEDRINRYAVGEFLARLVAKKRQTGSRIRVIDLGCGSGEGYEILTQAQDTIPSLSHQDVSVLPDSLLEAYRGVDINAAMLRQARHNYQGNAKLRFDTADLNDGLPVTPHDPPYDVYFSSFGSLSHLHDRAFKRLLEDICDHMADTAIFVADLAGRYSYEWPCYWDEPGVGEPKMWPYSMSYLSLPGRPDQDNIERFPFRYWGGEEFAAFVSEIVASKAITIAHQAFHDRSILVGRHMDTAEYNPKAPPLRAAVCSLHEFNRRTDLQTLLFHYTPRPNHSRINQFFEAFQTAWNAVIHATIAALGASRLSGQGLPDTHELYPDIVLQSIWTMREVIANVKWFSMDDPLANIVEPQLGYLLRDLEWHLQQGIGAAHGLLAIFEFRRTPT
jgi:SAM-dependent methyltransferase